MPNIIVLSAEHHAAKHWRRYSNYNFAKGEAVTLLVASELPKAMMSLPIAFIQKNEAFLPVAVLGLEPGKNLFVAQDGRWAGQYVPAALRGYPFVLARDEDKLMLCFDVDSGLIADGTEGEVLFGEDGKVVPAIQKVMDFLVQVEQSRVATAAACAMLQKHNCIRPWKITLKLEEGNERNTEGLFQIDEAAMNTLPDAAFLELRQSGALPIAYCQMLSMQHLPLLGQLAEAHAKAAQAAMPLPQDLDLEFLNEGGSISNDAGIISFTHLLQ